MDQSKRTVAIDCRRSLRKRGPILGELIDQSGRIVAFTGAGMSTECGVPDFRSSDSPWRRHKPIDFALFMSDVLMREEAWRRKFVLDDISAGAQPGRGHQALANLVANGKIAAIMTKNIDNRHQASGVAEEPPPRSSCYISRNHAAADGKRPPREWVEAKTQFAVVFGERFVIR